MGLDEVKPLRMAISVGNVKNNMLLGLDMDGSEIPNEETKAAFREADAMKADLSIGKTYMDVAEMMEELLKK